MKNNSAKSMIFNPIIISNTILLFMLSVRLFDNYLGDWIFASKIPARFSYFYAFSLYILTILLLWLNKNELTEMNIDSSFLSFVLFGGALLFLYLPIELGIVFSAVMFFFYLELRNDRFDARKNNTYPSWIWLLVVSAIGLAWQPVLLYSPTIKSSLGADEVFQAFVEAQLPGIIVEEILFRGALAAFLRRSGFREYTILIIPSILFWISHHKYLLLHNTYFFWVPLPLFSLLLGIVTLKSKSLIPSTVAHFLFNFISSIILLIYS